MSGEPSATPTGPRSHLPQSADTGETDGQVPQFGRRLPAGARIEDFIVPVPAKPLRPAPPGQTSHRGGQQPRRWHQGDPRPQAHPGGPGRESQRGGEQRPVRRRLWIFTIIGALALVVAPIAGLLGAAWLSLGPGVVDLINARSVGNGGTVTLGAERDRAIYSSPLRELEHCSVTSPDGTPRPVIPVEQRLTREGTMALPGARFTTAAEGSYTVGCDDIAEDARLMVSGPVVLRNTTAANFLGLGGIMVGAIGLGLLVYSVISLVRLRHRNS